MLILLFSLLLSLAGCIASTARAVQDLTPEQIDAITRLRQATDGDVFVCFNAGGGMGVPAAGSITALVYPRGVRPTIAFNAGCQLAQQGGGITIPAGAISIAPMTLVPAQVIGPSGNLVPYPNARTTIP